MQRRFFLLVLIISSFLISCGRITNEFNDIDEEDKDYSYKLLSSYGDYSISCYSTQAGGYGTYGQLIRDYTNGQLASIAKDDDSFFAISSNTTDAKSTTTNLINFSMTFPKRTVNSINIKSAFSALEDNYIASGGIKTPLALTAFTLYVTGTDGKEKSLSSLLSSFKPDEEGVKKGYELNKTVKVGYEITGVRVNATMAKYYGSYASTLKYTDLSYQQTSGNLSIYKIILE